MATLRNLKTALLIGALALTGCATKTATPEQYSGF